MKISKIIRRMAEIREGIEEVARLAGLGGAQEPWSKRRERIHLKFVWQRADELQKALIESLEEEYFDELGEGFNGNE